MPPRPLSWSRPTSFTSAPIAKALVEAHKRGVKIEVILDKSQRTEKYSEADFLRNMGIPVRIDAKHAIAHNKVMVIDDGVVITGSFNFTKAAEENNAENLLVIRDKALAVKYTANWKAHAGHSEAYEREKAYSETHREPACRSAVQDGFVASSELAGVSPAWLQVGREDRGEEPDPLCHPGRGDESREEAMCRMPAVRRWPRHGQANRLGHAST